MHKKLLLAASAVAVLSASPAFAASDADIEALRAEIAAMRQAYESKINQLETKVQTLTARQDQTAAKVTAIEPAAGKVVPATPERRVNDNSFNPEIGVILQGKYKHFSADEGEMAGFAMGHEGERGSEGIGIGETELNFSANIDDKFRGNATVALHEHGGETEVEVEEAFVETTSLPYGMQAKVGRFFSELGYLNAHHSHADDFADRPLTNRTFLNGSYGDDGVQISAVLPTDFYSEVGGGVYRGNDYPAGGADGDEIGAWSAYGRVGGDVGEDTSWRLGLSTLQANDVQRDGNDGTVTFKGDSNLYIADARLVYAPTGNNVEQEVILQGEYFIRDEDGTYEDSAASTGAVAYDDAQRGWYLQGAYKFRPQWRAGVRYSELYAGDVPAGLSGSALDDDGHDPWASAVMVDWTNSEFSRIRLQYNHEELSKDGDDDQIILQYIMSIGAHGAHAY